MRIFVKSYTGASLPLLQATEMPYISTNHNSPTVSLTEAIQRSIAPDGGLYLPERIPQVPGAFIRNSMEMTLREIAYAVTATLLGDEVEGEMLKDVVDSAFNFEIPLRNIDDHTFALELFHGPTLAVKDISSRFMTRLCMQLSRKAGHDLQLNVLLATNGNTGGAIADAVAQLKDVNVFVLFPKNERRYIGDNLRNSSPNVKAVEVQGTIADCKELVRQAMSDPTLRDNMHLVTANSTNIARLVPQVTLFFHAVSRLMAQGIDPSTCPVAIPVGNMTSLVAAVMARRMGLPLGPLVAACNANSHFPEFMYGGATAQSRSTVETLARAMDMGTPSNLPRLTTLYDGSLESMRRDITAVSISDHQINAAIASVYKRHGYLLDPHSAVAYAALEQTFADSSLRLLLATAHPAKSQETVEQATATTLRVPERLAYSSHLKRHSVKLPPTYPAFRKFLTNPA